MQIEIVSIEKLLQENLAIPEYQRPYRWGTESAKMLVADTLDACMQNVPEYRVGTVILHKEWKTDGKYIYNVVDGQQRLTTISILMYCFYKENRLEESQLKKDLLSCTKGTVGLFSSNYNGLSSEAIINNYKIIRRKVSELEDPDFSKYLHYLLNQCTMVKIVVDSEQEAFQFFDSQNSRGKPLAPHDLLKAYHLREMNDEPESSKVEIVSIWEDTDQSKLADFI